jgi:hypothetical protein
MAAAKRLAAMASGLVSASRIAATVRAFSRASTASGKLGRVNARRRRPSAASRSLGYDSVRSVSDARSLSEEPPSRAAISPRRSEIASSSRSPAPASSMPCVMAASPALPAGSRAPPAAKLTSISRIGKSCVSTK